MNFCPSCGGYETTAVGMFAHNAWCRSLVGPMMPNAYLPLAPQPPVATPPTATLGTLLDELEEWVAEAARLGAQGMSLSKAEGDALDAARAAVLEYVERLERERDALKDRLEVAQAERDERPLLWEEE